MAAEQEFKFKDSRDKEVSFMAETAIRDLDNDAPSTPPAQNSGTDDGNAAQTAPETAAPTTDGTPQDEYPFFAWDNQDKPFDANFVFHRVHSPVTNADTQPADGKGFDCGCRNLDDYDASFMGDVFSSALEGLLTKIPFIGQIILGLNQALKLVTNHDYLKEFLAFVEKNIEGMLFARFLGSVPEWVPVNRKTKEFQEEEREIEGLVMRSFLGDDDTPYIQWNHWYGWTFQVFPMPLYANVRGPGNVLNSAEKNEFTADPDRPNRDHHKESINEMALLDASPGSPDYRFLGGELPHGYRRVLPFACGTRRQRQ